MKEIKFIFITGTLHEVKVNIQKNEQINMCGQKKKGKQEQNNNLIVFTMDYVLDLYISLFI